MAQAMGGDAAAARPPPAPGKLLARPEAFKTLVNPKCSHCVDEAKRRAGELREDDRVLAWIRGYSQGGGIPLRFFLAPYRVISDTYGVFVYDPDAGFARGFEPSLEFEFYGWRDGVMVMRRKDGTLYSCLSGRAFEGPLKGQELKPIPTIATDWGFWLNAYPGAVAYHMFETYRPVELPAGVDPDSAATRGEADPRLPAAAPVLGIALPSAAAAYPIAALERAGGLIPDTLGDEKVVVLWYAATHTAAAYSTEIEGSEPPQTVTLAMDPQAPAAPFRDRESGSRWDIAGRAVAGPLMGKTLRWLPGVECRWFAWVAEHPRTQVYTGPKASGASPGTEAPDSRPPGPAPPRALEAVIVEPEAITRENVSLWKDQGFQAVAAVLDERRDPPVYRAAAEAAASGPLDLYCWIEVGRNPAMASLHPEWMGSLGVHTAWHERFPKAPLPREGEVAKAFPWVPIGYREAFDAHLERIGELWRRAPQGTRGLLLNDLQGGPGSCGCGNLQCRWALDYHVPATGTKLHGDDVAARFVAEVRKLVGSRAVVPVWTTECEDEDLPAKERPGGSSTGYCGDIPCATGTCPKAFTLQWSALVSSHPGSVGLLALHKEFARDRKEYGEPAGWIGRPLEYLERIPAKNGGKAVPRERIWLVVQGYDLTPAERVEIRRRAGRTGAGAVLLALTRLDQSYEPRIAQGK